MEPSGRLISLEPFLSRISLISPFFHSSGIRRETQADGYSLGLSPNPDRIYSEDNKGVDYNNPIRIPLKNKLFFKGIFNMIEFIKVQTQTEIQQVADLAQLIWNEHYTPIIGKAQVDYMVANFQSPPAIHDQLKKGYAYYLIEYENKPVGYFSILSQKTEKTLFLSKIYVDKSSRGKGLARKSIEFIQVLSENQGLKSIWLTVNKNNLDSIRAYQKMGFEIEQSLLQDIGGGFVMDDYKMVKRLDF